MLRQHADRYSAQGIVPIDMVAWTVVTNVTTRWYPNRHPRHRRFRIAKLGGSK
jgi:hypothetical protein